MKFFRKVRHHLLSENKIRKYLKYAVGEIFLVVIGILLALQISIWNQNYKNSKKESLIIEKLVTNLKTDSTNLVYRISEIEDHLHKIEIIENEINNDSLDQFSINITRPLLGVITLDLETTIWENLKSTGEINLIQNSDLTNELQWHYTQFNNTTLGWTDGIQSYSRNILAPWFFEFDDFSMFAPNSEDFTHGLQLKSPKRYGQEAFFRNAVRYRKGALTSIKNVLESDLTRTNQISLMLKEELNK